MLSLTTLGCSSPSEPSPTPPESHQLVVSSGNALLAVPDTGGAPDTLNVLEEATIILVHEVSPDGGSAAVLARVGVGTSASTELFLLGLEGSPTSAHVTGFTGSPNAISWSADSERLVFSTRSPPEIMTVGRHGVGLDTLVTLPLTGENPHWSPAGDRIVYVGRDTRVTDQEGLWTIRPDGSEATHIAVESVYISGSTGKLFPVPRFSPGSEWIAFESIGDLHVIRADGTGRRQLTATAGEDEWGFRWSPGGDRIAYMGDGGSRYEIRIMSFPEGAPAGGIEDDESSDRDSAYPEWSPDGERLAFNSSRIVSSAAYRLPGSDGTAAIAPRDESTGWTAEPLPVVLGSGRLPQWWPGH